MLRKSVFLAVLTTLPLLASPEAKAQDYQGWMQLHTDHMVGTLRTEIMNHDGRVLMRHAVGDRGGGSS